MGRGGTKGRREKGTISNESIIYTYIFESPRGKESREFSNLIQFFLESSNIINRGNMSYRTDEGTRHIERERARLN